MGVWPVRSQNSKIDWVSKTEHAGTNSGKLKVDSMIFGWAWSKWQRPVNWILFELIM